MADYWILDDENQPVLAEVMEWARFFENMARRRVAGDDIAGHFVSTVFIGTDHRFGDKGPPLLFETMVFPNDDWSDAECHRYSTWDDALTGHQATVRRLTDLARAADALLQKTCG